MGKRLLFVTTRLFWPANSGRKVSLYHYCRGLHERFDYDITLYSFLEHGQEKTDEEKPDFISRVVFAKPVGKPRAAANICARSLVGKHAWPLQCALYYSKENEKNLRALAKEIDPDVIVVDMVRLAPYLEAFDGCRAKKILDLDDLLSKRYERQLQKRDFTRVTGQYAANLGVLEKLTHGIFGKWLLRAEQRRLVGAETDFARRYDGVIFVSDKETDALNRALGEEKAVTVPLGVDADYFRAALATEKVAGRMGFVGNLSVSANVAALKLIAGDILPRIQSPHTLFVIGPCPQEVKAAYEGREDIVFTGEVPDLRPVMGSCVLALMPLSFGSGIKTKILEAMAMGVPVITNAVGAEGIDTASGKALLMGETPAELAALADRLLKDPEERAKQAAVAAELIAARYDWARVFDAFEALGL